MVDKRRNSWDRLSTSALDAAGDELKGQSTADRLLEDGPAPVEPAAVPQQPPAPTTINTLASPVDYDLWLKRYREDKGLKPELNEWAQAELLYALESWRRYDAVLNTKAPATISDLEGGSPNYRRTLTRLFEARNRLRTYVTDMHLVLMPWQEMHDAVGDLDAWFDKVWPVGSTDTLYVYPGITAKLDSHKPYYRNPDAPDDIISAEDYLDGRIAADGPWGMVLAQGSSGAGIPPAYNKSWKDESPAALLGKGRLAVEGYRVGSMGIFELMGLLLQEERGYFAKEVASWLPAMCDIEDINISGQKSVLLRMQRPNQAEIAINTTDMEISRKFNRVEPRLCVLANNLFYERPNLFAQMLQRVRRPTPPGYILKI